MLRLYTFLAAALLMLAGCTEKTTGLQPPRLPSPVNPVGNSGAGGPRNTFSSNGLYKHCAYLSGHENESDHHNLVVMYDGYLVMPFAPEWGGGGLSFWDISDGCSPQRIGTSWDDTMRESHNIAFSHVGDGEWAVVNDLQGIQFWDIRDKRASTVVSKLALDGVFYPDAYARVIFSVFWQGRYVYAAGTDNGIFIVNADNPSSPFLAAHYKFNFPLRVGGVWVIGNLLIATATEGPQTTMLDVSDPLAPIPLAGGTFDLTDGNGETRDAYHANIAGNTIVYARKTQGGGAILWDISDVHKPKFKSELHTPKGNGGYAFMKDEYVFIGDSNWGLIGDFTDHDHPKEVTKVTLAGDFDTLIPVGNMVVASVDDQAIPGQGSAMVPFLAEPDSRAPRVEMLYPRDGDTISRRSRIGLVFSEMVDVKSVYAGSVAIVSPDGQPVDALYNVQENIVNLTPKRHLAPETTYRLIVPAGGVADYNGNRMAEAFHATFTTER